jgi:hypothetical protein
MGRVSESKRTLLTVLSPIVAVTLFAVLQFIIIPTAKADAATLTRIDRLEAEQKGIVRDQAVTVTRVTVNERAIEGVNKSLDSIQAGVDKLIEMHLVKPGR